MAKTSSPRVRKSGKRNAPARIRIRTRRRKARRAARNAGRNARKS